MTRIADSSPGFIKGWLSGWFETRTVLGTEDVKDMASLLTKLKHKADPVSSYLSGKLSPDTAQALADCKDSSSADLRSLQSAVLQDLNSIVKKQSIFDAQAVCRRHLSERSRIAASVHPRKKKLEGDDRNRLNRMLLEDAYPQEIPFTDGVLCISDSGAADLRPWA